MERVYTAPERDSRTHVRNNSCSQPYSAATSRPNRSIMTSGWGPMAVASRTSTPAPAMSLTFSRHWSGVPTTANRFAHRGTKE